ncbi:SdrD B-like domain-containing protein [Thiocapsa sp. UBA6158]|uniref:SdrD B-like domain-containing protein n=1 Tax=Thiocapsa sp. UBA6158 TaxID=1947692 RepID=UPI0025CC4E40|nr:SdrD B-like domain-containing protein [Thiocapsa sp. UBA6158]
MDGDGTTAGDAGSAWTFAATGTLQPGSLNTWAASWDANSLPRGRYLIGVQAVDDRTKHDPGVPDAPIDHRTFSYLPGSSEPATQAQIYTNDWSWDGLAKIWVQGTEIGWIEGQETLFPAHAAPTDPGGEEDWYGNPDVTGVQTALIGVALNVCGLSPELIKSANVEQTTTGAAVQYTLSVVNKTGGPLTLTSIIDTLPEGFSYISTQGSGGTPASTLCTDSCPTPTTGGGNSYTWTFSPEATVPGNCAAADYAACTRTLVYNTTASDTVGTYNNTATMVTDFGSVASNPVQVGVGAPRLTLSKIPTDGASNPKYSALPGESITYVITYSNDSPVTATGVELTDVIPAGLTYVSCTGGCTLSGDTLTWQIGDLARGEGHYSVSFTATIADPYPDTAPVPNVNTATIDGSNTDPADATASVFVKVPRPNLVIQKTADTLLVDPAGTSPVNQVTYTLSYRNAGDGTATNAVITDVVPVGFSFVSATGDGAFASGTVTWSLGDLAPEATGSVTVTLQVSNPYSGTENPATNSATLDADNAAPVVDDANVGVRESGQVCSTYYFRDETGSVGFDGPQKLATTLPVPVAGDIGGSTLLTAPTGSSGNWSPPLSFYQDPASSSVVNLSGDLVTRMFIDRVNGLGIIVRTTVYDYNSVNGLRNQLGQGETPFGGNEKGLLTFSVPFASGAVLAKDHRLLWTYEVRSSVNNQSADILFQYSGTVANTLSGGSTSTFADSDAEYCSAAPANLALDKRVDQSSVDATGTGRSLTYTIGYANTGASPASGVKITDTLPAPGILSATCSVVDSTHFTGCSVTGGQVTFDNGSGVGVSIPAGESGSVSITAVLADNLTMTALTNTATISSNETTDLSASATTSVVGGDDPGGVSDLIIAKSASDTLLQPGESVTYTLTALNAGSKTATAILITDDFPDEAWLTFESGSCIASSGTCTPSAGSLTWAIDSLAPGETATLSFTLNVGTSSTTLPPDGVTTRDNLATGDSEGCETAPCETTSNTVTVSVTTNPYLAIEKSVSPSGVVAPGATLTYTLLVSNTGSGSANNLIVRDPIPANTSFIAGSTTQTQGSASFDAVNNQVIFNVGTIAGGGSATLTFQVKLNSPLPAGDSTLTNLATVTASNAPSRSDDAVTTAQAAPVLTLDKSGPASGAVQVVAMPTGAGTVTNLASIDSAETGPVEDSIQTAFGGLRITKRTTTPITPAPGEATYVIEVTNSLASPVEGVTLTDTLASGFAYKSTVSSTGATRTSALDPTVGTQQPTWGTWTLPANGSLTLTFTATVTDLVGAGTYQNEASVATSTTGVGITPFDPLSTTEEDVTVLPPNTGLVQGIIYQDNDGNGLFDPAVDTPLGGVAVTIIASDGTVYVAITDPSGFYSQVVPAGATLVDVQNGTVPPDLVLTTGTDGIDPTTVTVPVGGTASKNTGYVPAEPDLASITGNVWNDADDNRLVNGSEAGMIGVQVILRDSNGAIVATEYTDALGNYAFPNILPGDYQVDVVPPTGYLVTTGNDPAPVSVAAGETGTANFGLLEGVILSGTVFNDIDASGVQDSGEVGLNPGGLKVVVVDDSGQVLAVAPVENDGTWSAEVKTGSGYQAYYTLQSPTVGDTVTPLAQLPAGWLTTGENIEDTVQRPANGILIGIDANADQSGLNFGIRSGGSIGDYVWYDTNQDGIQDPAERGLAGVQVILYASDGTTQLAETRSDGSGKYEFAGLADGTYVVQFVTPAGYLRSPVNAGAGSLQDSFDSDASPSDGKVSVTIAGGTANPTVDAGFYIEGVSPASIADFVWYDTDGDGIQDEGEPGLGGVTVSLLDADNGNALVATRISDANGFYEFAGLPAGNYVLQFTAPTGYLLSPQDQGGDDTKDSDAAPGTGLTGPIALTAGQRLTDVDAGLSLTAGNPGSVGDRVWYDSDGNGIQDTGEPGTPGVRVNLYDATGTTLLQTTVTDPEGVYRFSGLPQGDYVVEVVKPSASYVFSPTGQDTSITDSDPDPTTGRVTVTLTASQNNTDIDAGLRVDGQSPISIGDFIWKDLDGQKDPDSGKGLANVEVVLYDSLGYPLARLTTDVTDANYGFTGVAAGGSFRVAIDTGSLGNLIQIADPDSMLDHRTDLINQTASTTAADFGYLAPATSISIVKTAADDTEIQQIRSGGTASFKVTVTNTGNLTLTSILVTDPLTPACNFEIASLAPGARSTVKTCTKDNVTADFTNIAEVEAQPVDVSGKPVGDKITAQDGTEVDVINPAITITKTPDTQTVSSGGKASFSIKVENTGDVTLSNVSVSDPLTSACDKTSADISGLGSMAPDAEVTYDCESSSLSASFVNVASVTATPPVGAAVTANDSASVTVVTPGISISKTPEEQTIHKGGTADFTIRVTNTGAVTLTGVQVTDPLTTACSKTSADIGGLASLAPDADVEYTCSLTDVNASFDNTATVTADGGFSADDVAKVTVIDPQLQLTKLTNDADGPITARTGTLVTWEYIVENTGDVDLTDVTVVDDQEGAISCPSDQLEVGASMTCLGYGLAGETSYSNVATATGKSPIDETVSAQDNSSYTGYNPGVIGNRIWLDENGNGIPNAGEPGIANLKVELKDGDTVVATAYTDTNGGYLFTDVTPGEYKIVVTPPPGLNPTYDEDSGVVSPDNESAVTLEAGDQHLTADFGYNWVPPADSTNPSASTTGAIGDRVWNDANGDGVQNPGESGIEGVTLTLTAPGDDGILGTSDDQVVATTQTDAAGNYVFDDLPSGAYAITVDTSTLPTGTGLTWTQTGDPDGAGSIDGKTTTPILLAPGDVYLNADFGYRPNQGSTIGDLIWFDMNANGQLDAGETGVPGIGIALVKDTNEDGVWDAGEPIIATTLTDASGGYLFPGLPEGDYVVVVRDAESLLYWALPSNDPDLPGQINDGLAPNPDFDQQAAVSVDGTSDQLDMDFGYMAYGMHNYSDIPGLIGSAGLVGDLVFLDRNGNEKADPGEGLQGVRVELFEPSDLVNPVAWTTTNAEGAYAFGHVNVQATWVVKIDRATLPNGGDGLTNSIDPDDGTDDQSTVSNISETGNLNLLQDFGYTAANPATIGGTLWEDLNANGFLDPSEASRLANITLVLRDSDGNKVAATQTDSQGNYSFTGLPAGTYSVHVTDTRNLLEGWWHSLGDQNPATDNTSKADPFTLTVTVGSSNTNIDFGYYYRGASLGNRVWSDTDGDGIQDNGEPGLSGMTVQLIVTYPNAGGSTTLKALSGSDGGYRFGNLLLDESFNGAGDNQPTYLMTVVAPDGFKPSPVGDGSQPLVDSNNPAGTTATVLKGQLNTAVSVDPATEPDNASYDFGYEPLIDLSLTKSVDPTIQEVNELVTFTLTLSNVAGFSNASGVKVTDLLPSGYSFVSATPSVGSYASGTGLWTVGNLAAGSSATLTLSARVNASGSYVNVAEVSAADQTDLDSTPGNGPQNPEEDDRASVTPTIAPQIDLSLTKSISPTTPKVGETVTFTLTLNNAAGYSDATGVSVEDLLPAGYGAITEISHGGSLSDGKLTWTGLTVQANTNKPLSFKAVVLPSGPYVNTAEVTAADQPDKDSTPDNSATLPNEDDTSSVSPTLTSQIDLSLTKSVSPETPKVGETVTFTLTLRNAAGYSDATGVSVQDLLPAGYGDVSEISDSGTLSGSTLTWSNLSVASGDSKALTFKAVVKNTGSYTNVAEVTAAGQPDQDSTPNNGATPVPEDDRATLTPTVDPQIDLSLTKTVSPLTAGVGETLTFTLTAANAPGFSKATGVEITDLLPSGYRVLSATPSTGSYDSVTGVWDLGDLAAGGLATLSIQARVMTRGEYENVAEVTAADQVDKDSTPGNSATEPNEDDTARSKPAVMTASIGDLVWLDTNGNGIQDPDEQGVAGVTVELYDQTGKQLLRTTQTDGSGAYRFDGLSDGDYQLVFVNPEPAIYSFTPQDESGGLTDLADSFDSDADPLTGAVSLTLVGTDITVDAGLYLTNGDRPSRISDWVWYDTNGDGIQDVGEPGVAGVIVKLYDVTGTQLIATTVTDGSGFYEFAGLPEGSYRVDFVLRDASWEFSQQYATDPDNDSDADASGRTDLILLTAGTNLTDIDAGMRIPGVAPATIGDRVWYDTNGDGIQNDLEPGIPGAGVKLYDTNGVLIASARTDADGLYAFTGLPAGDYLVEFELPVGYDRFSPPRNGDGTNDSAPDPTTGVATVKLVAGQTMVDIDAGIFIEDGAGDPLPPIQIGDYVWLDANGNTEPDESEWLDGVEVVLYDALGNELGRVTTDASVFDPQDPEANYLFTGVGQGSYRVAIDTSTLPAAVIQIVDPDMQLDHETELLGQTDDNPDVDFGYARVPPEAEDDEKLDNPIGTPVTIEVLGNDSAAEGRTLKPDSLQLVGTAAAGESLVVEGEGTWSVVADEDRVEITFTPLPGFTGNPTPITYIVRDDAGAVSNDATVRVTYVIAASIVRICDRNTPYVEYDIESDAIGPMSIQWYDLLPSGERGPANGDPLLDQPREGRLLWPGAEFNESGEVVTWPGWELIDDQWVRTNPRAQEIKEIVFSINPTISVLVKYPDPSASCRPYPPITVANDDESLGNALGTAVTLDILDNDVPLDERPFAPATVQILGTDAPGDSLLVENEGTWSVDETTGAITFTPLEGFPGNPTPIQYRVADSQEETSNPATVTITYEGAAVLSLLKEVADAPSPINLGSLITYRITATNTGAQVLSGVMISDDLPGLSELTCVPTIPGGPRTAPRMAGAANAGSRASPSVSSSARASPARTRPRAPRTT